MFLSLLPAISFINLWLAQLEGSPTNPSPLTEGATRIFQVGAEASASIAATFDGLWSSILQGALYQAMTQVGVLAAVGTLGFFLVQLATQLMSGDGDSAFSNLIWPIIVVVLLANNGAALADVTLGMRAIGNQVNTTVLSSTVKNVSLQQQYQQNRVGNAIDDMEAASVSECRELRGPTVTPRMRATCVVKARNSANRLRQQNGLTSADDDSWLRSAIQWLVRNFLYAVHTAFQWAMEVVLLIIALFGPLAVGLSLLPGNSKPLFTWVGGFASIFLMKLTLNLISGIAAYAVSQQGGGIANSLVLPIFLGLLSPILSVMVGLQGGSTFFNALSTASVYMGYRKAAGAAKGGGKALGKGGKAIGRGIGKGISRLRRR